MKLPASIENIKNSITAPIKSFLPSRGDGETHSLITTPWAWRTSDGIYIGHNGDAWLYRVLGCAPTFWEDPVAQLGLGSQLSSALYDLADTSKDLGVGMRTLAKLREIHLLSVTWEEPVKVPQSQSPELQRFLSDTLNFTSPSRAVVIGVKLRAGGNISEDASIMDRARQSVANTMKDKGPDTKRFTEDIHEVTTILNRYGISEAPSRAVRRQMEAWYNSGQHSDALLFEGQTSIYRSDRTTIELSALMSFGEDPIFHAPEGMWAFVAGLGSDPADVISVRCALEPSSLARTQIRRAERRMHSQIAEEEATDDLDRAEFREKLALGEEVERFVVSGNEPLLSDCSVVMARYVTPGSTDNYKDALVRNFGIEMKPLEMRQIPALRETLPCGIERVNPFLQSISVSMLAYAGLQSFSNLGDSKGAFLGLVDPDYTPCFLDPLAAPAANKPPAMLIAGEPGSGKTFTAQAIALQAALGGHKTIFINPKSDDTLEGLTDLVDGEVIRLSEISEDGGFFDPFRFCPSDDAGRGIAAEILTQHIFAVLGSRGVAGSGFTQAEEIAVTAGIRAGAAAGARCAAEAIAYIEDKDAAELIMQQATDPLFALGIGTKPAESYASAGDLLLIEFDKPLDIPESGISPAEYTRSQRLAVAAVRLCTRASLELLTNNDGGVMIVDEAWMFLQSSAGLAALQSIGRLGRSKNILPIFATQRVDDVIKEGVDMQSYLSRVLCMKLTDPREAKAALKLCGLEATDARIDWLREAGSKYDSDGNLIRGAMGLHKDLDDRHAAVMIGPFPEYARQSFSTNPEDRRARKEALAAEKEAAVLFASRMEAERLLVEREDEVEENTYPSAENTSQDLTADIDEKWTQTAIDGSLSDLTANIDGKWTQGSSDESPSDLTANIDGKWTSSPAEDDREEERHATSSKDLTENMDSKWTRADIATEDESATMSSAEDDLGTWNSAESGELSEDSWNSPADEGNAVDDSWNSPS